jgi:hypothetical protein
MSGGRGPPRRSKGFLVIASEAEAIHLAARPDEVWIASSLTLLAMTRSKRRLAILAVGEARFLQIEIAFDPPAAASMPWNRGGYSLKS